MPAPIAAWHRAVTPRRDIPLLPQGPNSCSSRYPPALVTPKPLWDAPVPLQPGAEPWMASRHSQWDPCTQPLHPKFGCRPGAAWLPPSPSHGCGARAELGSQRGWKPVLRLPGDGRHPGSPPSLASSPPHHRDAPQGCRLGTSHPFAPPMPQLVPLPPRKHVAIYHLAQLLYLADQN